MWMKDPNNLLESFSDRTDVSYPRINYDWRVREGGDDLFPELKKF